ncbi:MAG: Ig-like domain-containing protein [Gemmatimonadaceae bacterium]
MTRLSRHWILLAGLAALGAACGKDSSSSTSPGGTASTGLTIVIDSASQGQSSPVGSTITVGFTVMNATVTAPVPNQTVTLTPVTGSGTVSSGSAISDANGHATATWTFGTTSGTVSLTLAAGGFTINATATALAAAPTKLLKVSTDSQTVVATASASLVVRSTDQYGNPVPNIPVTWTSTGGTLTPPVTATGPGGNAAVTFTTGSVPTTYSITATSAGLTPVTFTLKGS